jgi:hypothetical protein
VSIEHVVEGNAEFGDIQDDGSTPTFETTATSPEKIIDSMLHIFFSDKYKIL